MDSQGLNSSIGIKFLSSLLVSEGTREEEQGTELRKIKNLNFDFKRGSRDSGVT